MLISELRPPSRSSSRPGCRQARSTSGGSTAGLRITVVANPQGTIAPLALRNQLSCQWNVLGPLKGASKSSAVELGVDRPPRLSWPPSTGGKQRSKRPRDGRPREREGTASGEGKCISPSPGGGPGG